MNNTLLYSVKEVAKLLHTSPNYVYELIDKNYLPCIQMKSKKVLKATLEEFLIMNVGNDLSDLNNVKKLSVQGGNLHGQDNY